MLDISQLFALALAALPIQEEPRAVATAFVNVTVVPMDSERTLENQTVLVEDGRIVAVGAYSEVNVPPDTLVVSGGGNFLMPGLVDMHVHNWDVGEHLLFLASGVTTVRNLFGSPFQLLWRKQIAKDERLGPTIVTAGPIVDGKPATWPGSREVETAEEAAAAVAEQANAGYDFIKVYNSLGADVYDAILVAAEEYGLPVDGHVPVAVGIETVLAGPQRTLEHLDGFDALIEAADSPSAGARDFISRLSAWSHADPARFEEVARRTRDADAWICPTEVVYEKWLPAEEVEAELALPHTRFVKPSTIAGWKSMAANIGPAHVSASRDGHGARLAFVKALQDAGAGLILGTDTGNPWVAAGFSLHDELDNFVEAGLTPYQALRAGTRSAAECLEQEHEFGSVAVGLRADLLLLATNPLEDVRAVRRPAGVMVRGRWLPRPELDRRLEAQAAKYAEER